MSQNKKTEEYNVKYNGTFKSLDAFTVLKSQTEIVKIINEIAIYEFPETNINVRIKGFKKGSLDVQQLIEIGTASGMFVIEHYEYIKTIFKIFSDIVKLKTFLGDEKAKSVVNNGTEVKLTIKGKNITIHPNAFKIYTDSPIINNSLSSTAQLLESQDEISNLEAFKKNKGQRKSRLLNIKKANIEKLKKENPYLSGNYIEQKYEGQILLIKKPNLLPEKGRVWRWSLIHKGRDIQANIEDDNFKSKIDKGLKIGKGDRLKADLIVKYKFDKKFQEYLETNRFIINNVTPIEGNPKQTQIDY